MWKILTVATIIGAVAGGACGFVLWLLTSAVGIPQVATSIGVFAAAGGYILFKRARWVILVQEAMVG